MFMLSFLWSLLDCKITNFLSSRRLEASIQSIFGVFPLDYKSPLHPAPLSGLLDKARGSYMPTVCALSLSLSLPPSRSHTHTTTTTNKNYFYECFACVRYPEVTEGTGNWIRVLQKNKPVLLIDEPSLLPQEFIFSVNSTWNLPIRFYKSYLLN